MELALVTPILLLLLLGAIDLGRLFYARITVANAAREGAMVAATNPTSFSSGAACGPSNRVMCAATREPNGSFVTVAPADVALACDPSCTKANGNRVTVTVTGHFRLLTPLMWAFTGGPDITFAQSATADMVVLPAAAGLPTPTPTPAPTPTPTASATATPTPTPSPTCAPASVSFTYSQQNRNRPVVFTSTASPTSGACAITFWRWEYGDGNTDAGNLPTVSHDYGSAHQDTTFNVTLSVTNPAGTYSFTAAVRTK